MIKFCRHLLFRQTGIRQISSIQNLLSNTNNNPHPSNEEDDEKLCAELIDATHKIISYKPETKLNHRLIEMNPQLRLRHYLRCSDEEALQMIKNCPILDSLETMKSSQIEDAIESLLKNDITRESIINNPFLLTMTGGTYYLLYLHN